MKATEHSIKHELNEALRNVLNAEGIKVKDATSYNLVLLDDYTKLLIKFKEHLAMVVKINREVEE